MGVFSEVEGIPAPYDRQVKLWDEGRTYRKGDEVPRVGVTDTYAVRLGGPGGKDARYLTVQEGRITNLLAHQPVHGRSVFDKWGGFLGVGGEKLDEPPRDPRRDPVPVVDAITRPRTPTPDIAEIVEDSTEGGAPTATLTHRFHLRPDCEVELRLPADLTGADAERLARFVLALPF